MADLNLNTQDFYPDFITVRAKRTEDFVEDCKSVSQVIKKTEPKFRLEDFKSHKTYSEFTTELKHKVRLVLTEKVPKANYDNSNKVVFLYDPDTFEPTTKFLPTISKHNREILRREFLKVFNMPYKKPSIEQQDLGIEEVLFIYESLGIINEDNEEDRNNVMCFFALCCNGIVL